MAQAIILDSISLEGTDVLAEARAEIRKLTTLNVRVPKMRIRGPWKMNGFDFDFEDWQDAYPPLGNKYLKAGERKAHVEPTEESELEIFFVFSGESITEKNPLAEGDLFGAVEEREDDPATDPEDPEDNE